MAAIYIGQAIILWIKSVNGVLIVFSHSFTNKNFTKSFKFKENKSLIWKNIIWYYCINHYYIRYSFDDSSVNTIINVQLNIK